VHAKLEKIAALHIKGGREEQKRHAGDK